MIFAMLALAGALAQVVLPDADTPRGGHGAPVAGIKCEAMEVVRYHVHAHLALVVDGKPILVPSGIGIVHTSPASGCFYWLHTHNDSGIIHVEAPRGGQRLGAFFAIWGEPLSRDGFTTARGHVQAFLNGRPWPGSPRDIPLDSHNEITLRIRTNAALPTPFPFSPDQP